MDNWRLSKIEEELDRLDIAHYDDEDLPLPPMPGTTDIDQDIYSKVVILPAYKKQSEGDSKEGIRRITEKYDSLGRVKPFVENNIYTPEVIHLDKDRQMFQGNNTSIKGGVAARTVDGMNHNRMGQLSQENLLSAPHEMYYGQQDKTLSENEMLQVEMFYRSHKTEVYVCACAAHMYFGNVPKVSPSHSPVHTQTPDNWTFVKTGIPVLVLDSGESRRHRRLYITMAEKGTGFALWRDCINHLTNYKPVHGSFHTLHLSNDHTKMVGLSFDDQGAATDFIHRVVTLTSDPNDDVLNLSSKKKKKDAKKKKGKYKAPNKSDISSPCCFTHVTKLDRSDGMTILGSSAPTSPQIHRDRDHRPSLKKCSPIKMPNMKVSSMIPNDS